MTMTKKTIRIMLLFSVMLIVANIVFNVFFWFIIPDNYQKSGNLNFIVFIAHQGVMLILMGLPLLILNIVLTIFLFPLITHNFDLNKTPKKIFWKVLIFPLTIVTFGLSILLIIIFALKKMKSNKTI